MSPAGFDPATPESELPQTHALDRAATGIVPPFPDTVIKTFIAFSIISYQQEEHRPTTMLKSRCFLRTVCCKLLRMHNVKRSLNSN